AYHGIELVGLAVHIGSLLTDLLPCLHAFERTADAFHRIRAMGLPLHRLDLGGGLGIAYRGETVPSLDDYVQTVRKATDGLEAELAFEPGRRIVGEAGILVSKVEYVKQGRDRQFVILDAAMNDLIRPMLYDAWHEMIPLHEPAGTDGQIPVDVVGPVCESTDTFAKERRLPPLKEGDLIAICSTGAYGAVMSSTYNSRLLVPEVMVHGDWHAVIRPRQSFEDLIAQDRVPSWLK
ncbi:MAG: diaminopimelate decarboxylase, partial [Kiloniellales bacterium]|nr:diaminopimelate decarboxylase [Kiloniellales bacterium]